MLKKHDNPKKSINSKLPVGRTLKTEDKYLPHDKKKVRELKDKRWVAVIDKNKKEELAVVRLTDEHQPNTTEIPTYKKGNQKKTYFKHFVEIEDNEGKPITVDNERFRENNKKYDLSAQEVSQIRDKSLYHSKQATENRKKIERLKKRR